MYYSYTMPQIPAEMTMAVPPETMALPTTVSMPVVNAMAPDLLTTSKLDPQSVAKRLKERYDKSFSVVYKFAQKMWMTSCIFLFIFFTQSRSR